MGNYASAERTNFFHVKDEERFRKTFQEAFESDDFHLWEEKDAEGNTVFAFGGQSKFYSTIDHNYGYHRFISFLQESVARDDVIVFMKVESEVTKDVPSVMGDVILVTSNDTQRINLAHMAWEHAQEMLQEQKVS